jgi:hypothetical protein
MITRIGLEVLRRDKPLIEEDGGHCFRTVIYNEIPTTAAPWRRITLCDQSIKSLFSRPNITPPQLLPTCSY